MSLNVYIAGAYRDRQRAAHWMTKVVTTPGLELAHDWVDIIDSVKAVHGEEHDTAITNEARRQYAMGDLEKVRKSDLLWFLVPQDGGRGCWFEDGVAWALRIPMIASGPNSRVTIFTELSDGIFGDDEDAFVWVKRFAQERQL